MVCIARVVQPASSHQKMTRFTAFTVVLASLLILGQRAHADSWTSLGCFSDSLTSRALGDASLLNQPSFTLTQCTNFCGSYKYVGIENGKDCYCANTINPSSVNVGQFACNVLCTGQPDTYCGGLNAIQIFRHDVPPPIVWNSIGCYTDSTSSRTLRTASFTSVNNMTVAACKAYCANYPYAGVEYARECYCDTVIHSPGALATYSDCNMPCTGNAAENCGAGDRIEIFQKQV